MGCPDVCRGISIFVAIDTMLLCRYSVATMSDPTAESEETTRRRFLRQLGMGAAGLAVALPAGLPSGFLLSPSKVVVVRSRTCVDPGTLEAMLQQGLQSLTGTGNLPIALSHFVERQDRVGIKVSVMSPPTHDALKTAFAWMAKRCGIGESQIRFWDRDRMRMNDESSTDRGISVGCDDGLSRVITRHATALINMPRLKAHWLSGISGALKNWTGAVSGLNPEDRGTRFPIHRDHCREVGMLQALPAIRQRSRLVVMDALRIHCAGGPQVRERYVWEARAVVLGADPVAVDAVGLDLVREGQQRLRCEKSRLQEESKHIRVASEVFGLGEWKLSRIDRVEVSAG